MYYPTENEKKENIRRAEMSMARERAKYERNDEVFRFFRVVFFTPLAIVFKVISFASKVIGGISSIGIPFGLYCLYKDIVAMKGGTALADIHNLVFIELFVILPFASFALHFIAEKLHQYFFRNSL